MLKLSKKFSGYIIILIIFNIFASFSYGDFINIYEKKEAQNLSEGVLHERILRFTDQGWLSVNVLRINLKNRDTELEVLTSQGGISNKKTLSELALENEFNNKIVAAINGDFYDTKDLATMGPIVKDGELITGTIHDPSFASFNLDEDNHPFLEYWTQEKITLENEENGFLLNVDFKNKPYLNGYADRVVLLDRSWSQSSFGIAKNNDIVEMVVVKNKVKEIRDNQDPIEIPEDGYIIIGVASTKELILNNFAVGDEVSLDIVTSPDFESLKLALGGGAIIIKDGEIVKDFSLKIPGRHPRTAIGITKDNRELILVTIDGRTSSYLGATQEELAKILLELDAYNAINMDGGGSTEMIIRELGDIDLTIANKPSSGFERRIINGLGVINDSRTTSLREIFIECDDTKVFVNTTRAFTVKGYDRNYNPVEINQERVNWSVEGVEGQFINNVFYPSTSGKGIVKAYYNGETATKEINVLNNPVKLEVTPSKIFVDTGSEINLSARAINDDGYSAKVNLRDLIWSIPDNIGEIIDGALLTSSKPGNNIITATLSNISAYIHVANGYEEVLLNDFEGLNGQFLAFPQEVTGYYELTSTAKNGKRAGRLQYDFSNSDATRAAYVVFNNDGLVMETRPEKIGLWVYGSRGNNHWLRGRIIDSNGTEFNIDFSRDIDWNGWKKVEATIPSAAVAPLKLQRIYIVEIDPMKKDNGYILLDDLTAFYKSGFTKEVPKDSIIAIDKRNTIAELTGDNSFKLIAHGQIRDTKTLLDKLVMNKIGEITNASEKSIIANTINQDLKEKLTTAPIMMDNSYSIQSYKNSTFIKLNNTNNGIRGTDYKQWTWLFDNIKNINTKNVFILMPQPFYFNDQLEEKLFMDILRDLKEKGKDVWVITGGNNDKYEVTAKDGIRFVKLKSYPASNEIDIYNDLKYMEFIVNDGYVTYQIREMYGK